MWVQRGKHAESVINRIDGCYLPRLRLLRYSLRPMLPSWLGVTRPTSRVTAELSPTASMPTHNVWTFSTSTDTWRRTVSIIISWCFDFFCVKDFLDLSPYLWLARRCSGRRRWRCRGTRPRPCPGQSLPRRRSLGRSARWWRPWSRRWTHRLWKKYNKRKKNKTFMVSHQAAQLKISTTLPPAVSDEHLVGTSVLFLLICAKDEMQNVQDVY